MYVLGGLYAKFSLLNSEAECVNCFTDLNGIPNPW